MEFTLKFKLLVLGIVVFLTTLAIAVYINTYVVRSRAAATAVPIAIIEKAGSIAGTKEIFVTFKVPGKISFFSFNLKSTGSVAVQSSKEPQVVGGSTAVPANFFSELTKTTAKIAYSISKPDADLPVALTVPITLTCNAAGTGTFTIDGTTSEIVGPGGPYTLDPVDVGSYVCTSIGSGGGVPAPTTAVTGPKAHFSPALGRGAIGEQITTNFVIDGLAAGQQISGFDATMTVPDGVVLSFTDSTVSTNTACKTVIKSFDATTRVARISQLCTGATLLTSVQVPMVLKGSKDVTGKVSITNLEVVGPASPNGYTLAREDFGLQIGAGSSTGGGTGGGSSTSMQIQLSLRLQGIQSKPKNAGPMQFKVSVINKSMDKPVTQNAAFTPDDRGIYRGSVGFNLPEGTGYTIFVKGPMHLQKKLCDIKPGEATPGTYSCDKGVISLKNGDNAFDFTGVYMMSCDFGAQDGICNAGDMALIFNNLGTTDAAIINSADINRDGALNTTDHALAIASLSIKVDDR